MQRKKSLLAATIISATLLTGAVAYAASSGVLDGRNDNVGNLQSTAIQTTDVGANSGTDSVTPPKPATATNTSTAVAQPGAAVTPRLTDDRGHDDDDDLVDDHGGDRGHGRGGDDD